MQVDIRLHLGSMLTLLGLLLAGYGIFSDPAIYKISLGLNVNLYTGGLMLALGLLFFLSAWLGRSKENSPAPTEATSERASSKASS